MARALVDAIPEERAEREGADEEQHAHAAALLQEFRRGLTHHATDDDQEHRVHHGPDEVEGRNLQ